MGRAAKWPVLIAMLVPLLAGGAGQPALAGEKGHGGEDGKHRAQTHGGTEKLARPLVPKLPPDVREDYQKYCYNVSDAARDARFARQKRQMKEMEERLGKLLEKLEKKRAEYETWVKRRREITERMTRSMLDVYAEMEPDAAAAQIARMEYAVAVAILTGLKPQKASAILTEMDPRTAGRLVNVIVGAVAEAAPARPTGETN